MITVTTRQQNEITILDLKGNIDLEGITVLKEAISGVRKAGCMKLIINMKDVSNIVSTVLGSLQPTVMAFWACQGKLILSNVAVGNLRVLEKEQFFKMVSVMESEEEAIKRLGGQVD